MAEKIISPGVFTNEIDQTFLPSAVADIGAAIIGPTVKGPAGVPTVVTSFSDFQAKFGDVVKSGSDSVQFLTSHAAEEYLKNSDTLTVVRVMDGTFAPATASVATSGSIDGTGDTFASASIKFIQAASGSSGIGAQSNADEIQIGGVDFTFVSSSAVPGLNNSATQIFVPFESVNALDNANGIVGNIMSSSQAFVDAINNSSSLHGLSITAARGATSTVAVISSSIKGENANIAISTGSFVSIADTGPFLFTEVDLSTKLAVVDNPSTLLGGTNGTSGTAFVLRTIADGTIMNNGAMSVGTDSGTNQVLLSGSVHNVRYEVASNNPKKGTFNLLIRAGNDNVKRKQTLESFNDLSLDPNSVNYIAKRIGDQRQTVRTDGSTKYLQLSGSYANKSRFVTVESITNTSDYLDENGEVRVPATSQSLPQVGSGSELGGFGGGADGQVGFDALGNQNGSVSDPVNFYENISTQTQGFTPSDLITDDGGLAYSNALDLLKNQDEFDVNLLLLPGLTHDTHNTVLNKAIDVCEDRGDCFAIIDPVTYDKNPSAAVTQAETQDSNFAAMYYPWVKVPDSQVAGTQRWVPPSVVLGGIYAFNDRVAHPWFAPAGLNRGGITSAIQAERKLTQGERDTLYDSNVNPIATFPGQGVTVFGQKTLQKKPSALDRINVRRLLIRVKKFIASSSRFLVFEQNTSATRRRFLGIVNPFLENVQSQSGLSAFRVVMDETNNTPDTIDRNQLIGQLFLQPTRTAEFIVLDFTIQPTGASFPE